MWEERFRRLTEWKRLHGHCAVPIAQGELGTWVSKQRQLRKRGKLSKEKVDALDSLKFTWSTAEADWEEKFKRLCEWTGRNGHASVPFNEGELGWWVNTQRQCKRKGKLSRSREERLESLGFVWNPSSLRARGAKREKVKEVLDLFLEEKDEGERENEIEGCEKMEGEEEYCGPVSGPMAGPVGSMVSQSIWCESGSLSVMSSPLLNIAGIQVLPVPQPFGTTSTIGYQQSDTIANVVPDRCEGLEELLGIDY